MSAGNKKRCKGNGEGNFCPACWRELDNWHERNKVCETCGVDVYTPLDYEQVQAEKQEQAGIEWSEMIREVF